MHGWISLPVFWQIALLALASLIGLVVGFYEARNKHQMRLWLGYTAAYAILVTLVAFLYESHGHFGQYDLRALRAWALMIALPVFVYALPAIGVPWFFARVAARARLSSAELQHAAGTGASVSGRILIATALVLSGLLFAVVLENAPLPRPHSTYVMAPLDPAHAPSDLSPVTDGSDWVCNILSEGKPSQTMVDYHFEALTAGGRWQSFSHHGERPFFDLDHAQLLDTFFSGPYSVAAGRLKLGSDYAGMSIERDRRFAKQGDRDALRAAHDPRLHGETLLSPNAILGSIESIAFRSLSASEMSLVIDYANDVPYSSELVCRRVHDAAFKPIEMPPTEPRRPAA